MANNNTRITARNDGGDSFRQNLNTGLLADIQQRMQQLLPHMTGVSGLTSDTTLSLHTHVGDLKSDLSIEAGIVQYSIPVFGCQRIQFENAGGKKVARTATLGSGEPGAYDVSTWPHGSNVYAIVDKDNGVATVIASPPPLNEASDDAFSDYIAAGSGVGLFASPQYFDYVNTLEDAGGVMMWQSDRPIDGLPGDHTVMSATGVGLHLDDEMAFLRSSEISGLFIFREDGYVRLTGESLAVESPQSHEESGLANFELFAHGKEFVYPWEMMGSQQPTEVALTEHEDEAYYQGPWGEMEPKTTGAEPLARIETFAGYLGQGRLLVLNSPQYSGGAVNTIDAPVSRRGLFREQLLIDGTYMLESARQMFFVKATDIPFVSVKAPFDETTDNYKASGHFGSGSEHKVSGLDSNDPAALTVGAEHMYAYASAWQGMHACVYHPNIEVEYPEASFSQNSPQPNLSQQDQILPTDVSQVEIDHRYNTVDVYRALSMFGFLPNGDIVIEDGQGASIKLTGGRIELSGISLSVNVAKTFNAFAGTVSLNGHNHVELTSASKDVRIKAERNMMLLSGNGGEGGTLIESRGASKESKYPSKAEDAVAAGVAIKSVKSFVGLYGGDVYLKSGPPSAGGVQGDIHLDAGFGEITSKSQNFRRYVEDTYYDSFGLSPEAVRAVNTFDEARSTLNSELSLSGKLFADGDIYATSNFRSLSGHYFSPKGGFVTVDSSGSAVRQSQRELYETQESETGLSTAHLLDIQNELASTDQPLNGGTIYNMSFGFPSSQEYKAREVTLSEPRWHRTLSADSSSWQEKEVQYNPGDSTMPWPGKDTWQRDSSFRVVDKSGAAQYFDEQRKSPKDPTANQQLYEEAESPSVSTQSLKNSLRTIT